MKYAKLAIILLIFGCLQACSTPEPAKKTEPAINPAAPETSSIAPALERDVLYYINKHRESKGLSPLTFNAIIASEARKHSTNMASKRVPFGHQGMSTRTKSIKGKIKTVGIVSENVARGPLTAQQVVTLWLKSAGHKKNIEGKFKYTGIGVARDRKSDLYFTQIFTD